MEQIITFITLGVKDLNTSADFYENKFGWKRSDRSSEGLVVFQMNGVLLSLYSREELAKDANMKPNGEGFKGFAMAHNLGSEQEVNDLFAELKAKQVQIIKEPEKVFWGGYSGYVADPDGNIWEIAYNPFL
ncbi:MAG: VOC family protein [Prevotellaceae bacterium]|jgi:uncharacterized glyoxalase superfamily protein PhnB|nr:VOC family protein [Prevotellaceae bacterium]